MKKYEEDEYDDYDDEEYEEVGLDDGLKTKYIVTIAIAIAIIIAILFC